MYCINCGAALKDDVHFCPACGTSINPSPFVSRSAPLIPATPPTTKVIIVSPKRAGRLAIKAFFASFFLYVLGAMSLQSISDRSVLIWLAVTFGAGACYVVVRLRRWKQQNDPATGFVTGWMLVACMVMISLGGITGASSAGSSRSSSSSSRSSNASAVDTPSGLGGSKEIVMRDTRLDFAWSKDGFGNIMMADFSIHNPTPYRFKDVEIKCTHFAPSGTEIDSNTRTIYEIVEPRSTKKIKQMNMGFIHSQAARSRCGISDLTILQ